MTLSDAAGILGLVPDRPLDPPITSWTDADERDYATWLAQWREDSLLQEFSEAHADLFDEFCRDKFEDEQRAQGGAK